MNIVPVLHELIAGYGQMAFGLVCLLAVWRLIIVPLIRANTTATRALAIASTNMELVTRSAERMVQLLVSERERYAGPSTPGGGGAA